MHFRVDKGEQNLTLLSRSLIQSNREAKHVYKSQKALTLSTNYV